MRKPIIISASAQIEAASSDGEQRFRVDAYGGGPLRVAGYDLPIVVDLAGLDSDGRIVANLDHDQAQRVGHVDQVENDGQKLSLSGIVSAASRSAKEFVESARRKFPWAASIEARPSKFLDVPRGETVFVNGRNQEGPFLLARTAQLVGIAFLSHGADASAAAFLARKNMNEDKSFGHFMDTMYTGNVDDLTAKQLANFHATYSGRPGTEVNDADRAAVAPLIAASATSDPVELEKKRLRQIDAATAAPDDWFDASNNRSEPQEGWGKFTNDVAELKANAIKGDLGIDDLLEGMRTVGYEKLKATVPAARPRGSSLSREADAQVIEAALCQSAGVNVDKLYPERVLQAAHSRFRGGFSLQQLLLSSAQNNGMDVRAGQRVTSGNIREVLQFCFPPTPIQASAFSTLSLPGILSNAGNKSLLQGWEDGDQTWREIAQIKTVSDFKEAVSYRLLDSMEYSELGPDGEIKHGELSQESYTRQASTYAKMFGITRQDIINDDLSAFEDVRQRVGRGAIAKFNQVFWSTFMDNATFFAVENGNAVGAAGDLKDADGAALESAVLAFRKLKSPDGKIVDGEPSTLLVPPELEFAARKLYQSTNLVSAGGTDATLASANIHGGLYMPVIQTRLSDASYTGNSESAWYLLRPPAIAAAVCVSFLDGKAEPTVDVAEADFNQLGIQMRGYHDFGCDRTVDYLSGIRVNTP